SRRLLGGPRVQRHLGGSTALGSQSGRRHTKGRRPQQGPPFPAAPGFLVLHVSLRVNASIHLIRLLRRSFEGATKEPGTSAYRVLAEIRSRCSESREEPVGNVWELCAFDEQATRGLALRGRRFDPPGGVPDTSRARGRVL